MEGYYSRIADNELKKRLESSGAVLVQGAKWCGKTTTARNVARSVLFMQDPNRARENLQTSAIYPTRLLEGETPRLIDEWQMAPNLWDAVRFMVDERGKMGQFILTGSAVPVDTGAIHHSGVGRISRLLMRPMTLYESKEANGEVSLGELFRGAKSIEGKSELSFENLAFAICRGGWPQSVVCAREVALRQAYDYYDGVVELDMPRLDGVERNGSRLRRLMRAYARHLGSQSKYSELISDMAANDSGTLSNVTVAGYVEALKKIFVIEDSPAWNVNLRSRTAIRTTDTRYFVDPSIGAAALRIGPGDLLNDLNTMGILFENLCVRDLRVFAEANDGEVYHYRDANGLECDAVIHLHNGKYGLVEIKLGGAENIEVAAKTLNKLADKIDTVKMGEPAFRMVLTGTGEYAYTRLDGVHVVPIGCLKA